MAGLLGLEDDPASQGLLSLGLRLMSTPGSFMSALGQSGLGAMGDLNSAAQAKQRRDLLAQEQRSREQQMQIQAQAMKQAQAEQQRQEAIRQAYTGAMRSPDQQAMGQFGGPTNAAAQAAPGMAPQFDQQALIRSLSQVDPMTAYQMAQPKAKKLSKLEPMRGPDGKMINVAVYEDGTTSVLPYGVRPDIALQNLGNRVQAIDKNDTSGGQSFAMGQSPDSAASNAVTMRGQNMTRDTASARLSFDSTKPAAVKVDPNAQKVSDARDVLQILGMAEPLLKESTGSYLGAGVDEVARAFGKSTTGAEAAAQLKTLQGSLISKMPKMSGPQSDKDVQLYREMAGQIGDATLPIETRQAAIRTIRRINEAYAGQQARPIGVDTSIGVPKIKFLGFE